MNLIIRLSVIIAVCMAVIFEAEAKPKKLTETITWEISEDSVLYICGVGEMPDGWEAPYKKKHRRFRRIIISEGITHIGMSDFSFIEITDRAIVLPSTLQSIGKYAFSDIYGGVSGIELPDGLKSIGNEAFTRSLQMDKLEIPASVTEIGADAFRGCEIGSLTFCGTLPQKMDYAFRGVQLLESVDFNHKGGVVPFGCFESCPDLNVLLNAECVDKVESFAFSKTPLARDFENVRYMVDYLAKYSLKACLEKYMPSWSSYVVRNMKSESYDSSKVKAKVTAEMEQWQAKGEFESSAQYSKRVNEQTRKAYLEQLVKKCTAEAEAANRKYEAEYAALQDKYKAERERIIQDYYSRRIADAEQKFKHDFYMDTPYDADNNTFLIRSSQLGDILLPVPADEAPAFKAQWPAIKRRARAEYKPDGDGVALSNIVFPDYENNRSYTYDSHTEAVYALADDNTDFTPLVIPEIQIGDLTLAPVVAASEKGKEVTTAAAPKQSKVDTSIPVGEIVADNTFALIIANEHYRRESSVPFAANDGSVFARYVHKTLGVPEKNIKLMTDASLNDIRFAVRNLAQICDAYNGEASLIVYYAGHGIPDESTRDAYLLPVDGFGSDPSTGYSLKDLYAELGAMPTRGTTMFVDACFSGAVREGGMMRSARGVALKSKPTDAMGNMVVFSASQGDETAYPYTSESHGLFTYFLLEKLQETGGKVTLGELSDYLIDNVKRVSVTDHEKMQTPAVSAGRSAGDWRTRRL